MTVSRRKFVLSASLFSLMSVPNYAVSLNNSSKTVFIILDGLEATENPALAAKVLEEFFANGIPITALLRCSTGQGDSNLGDFATLFNTTLEKERGLFEVAFDITQKDDAERYFRVRDAIDLRDCMKRQLDNQSAFPVGAPIVTVLNRGQKEPLDPFAMRGGGFRIQLRPELDEDAKIISAAGGYSVIDWGIAQVTGGDFFLINDDPDAAVLQQSPSNEAQAVYLSFREISGFDQDTVLAFGAAWAARFQKMMMEDNVFLTRPVDHLLQGNPGASKYVGLALDMSDPTQALTDFAARIEMAGFSLSYLNVAETSAGAENIEDCVFEQRSETDWLGHRCLVLDGSLALPHEHIAEIILNRTENPYFWGGPRSDGRYHAAIRQNGIDNFSTLMEQDPLTDTILVIGPEHVATPIQQDILIGKLSQVRSDGKAHFFSIQGYINQTLAPDPVTERFWSTRRRQALDAPKQRVLGPEDKNKYLNDAQLAWRFIERFTDAETGICAGTVQVGSPDIVNFEVTLWDVASQIHGIISANYLGIITNDDARQRVERLLNNMPVADIDGLSLPPALFRSDKPNDARNEFDSCDTGRFLIALNSLVSTGLVTKERAKMVFEQWEIAKTVRNQNPFNFSKGTWEDVGVSHCAHYARHGYAAWGVEIKTAYPELPDNANGDDHLRLLYQAAIIGHFGTEPLLLEAIEVGFSPETKYLSDVLFDAQLSWFEETGHYKCVSEAALNFSPWFSYQGLRVDRRGQESWVISTINSGAGYQNADFFARADILSSKAAYLWAAAYPHDYSNGLIDIIRGKAKINGLGFSIGVFSNTQLAMTGYSDVNTNGIILTAIANIFQTT